MTVPGWTSSAASRARGFGPPTATGAPSAATSSGPRIRNCTVGPHSSCAAIRLQAGPATVARPRFQSDRVEGAQMRAVTERSELSSIAYGFMASKALFAALGVDLFTHLAAGPRTTAELSDDTGIAAHPLQTLLHALSALGLIVAEGKSYTNAPACQRYLARGSPGEYGEYFRLQVAQQIYPALVHLDAGLAGIGAAFDTFADLLSRPDEARTFTAAQHAGSHAAARVLAERTPLGGARTMLDVGGGSGAFSIALCARHPCLSATVLDFPAVVD